MAVKVLLDTTITTNFLACGVARRYYRVYRSIHQRVLSQYFYSLLWDPFLRKVSRVFLRCWICWGEPSIPLMEHLQWDRSRMLFRVILAWPSEGILCDVLVVMMYFLKIVSLTWIHENILTFLSWLTCILETATSHARDGMSNRTGSGWESKSPARREAVIGLLIVFRRAVWGHDA